jgi:ferredoxin--NADP+ reductase
MRAQDRTLAKKVELLREFSTRARTGKPKLLTLRFLVSPVELHGDASGRVIGMRLVRNALIKEPNGALRAAPIGWFEELPVELVFRSVGYRGVPLPGVPFDGDSGTIPNVSGRVVSPDTRHPTPGLYVAGWIKRGPSGVIGTNKPDAAETAEAMLEDLERGEVPRPAEPSAAAALRLLRERVPCLITFEDWKKLDALESERGKAGGRPRVKMSEAEMMKKLGCE